MQVTLTRPHGPMAGKTPSTTSSKQSAPVDAVGSLSKLMHIIRVSRLGATLLVVPARREFTVNIISEWFLEAANHTCGPFDPDVDEMALAGLTPVRSTQHVPGTDCVLVIRHLVVDSLGARACWSGSARRFLVQAIRRQPPQCLFHSARTASL